MKLVLGAVLGLKVKKLSKKFSFKVFKEKAKTNILCAFKNPKEVLPIIIKDGRPNWGFNKNNEPDELTGEKR